MEPDKDLVEGQEVEQVVERDEAEVVQTPVLSEDEKTAQSAGWQTKEDWIAAGKPEDEWKPAKVFNEIGSLKEKLAEKERETKKLNKVVELMKTHHLNVREAAVKQAVEQLRKERLEALESQDFAKAEQIRDNIDDLKARANTGSALPAEIETQIKEVEKTEKAPDPVFAAFRERNPWYKTGKNADEMSKKVDALGYSYGMQDPNRDFADILKEVEKDIKRLFPEKFETPRNPVNEGGSRGTGASKEADTKVSLSDEEKRIARSFGMTDAEYAKEQKSYRGR
jgi:phage I-like protein